MVKERIGLHHLSRYHRCKFTSAAASKATSATSLGNLLIVASIAKTLSRPGGIYSLDRDGDSIPLSDDIVRQILRRGSLDASRKLDFFRWCSLRHNYKHSAGTYSQMLKAVCLLPHNYYDDILELLASMRRDEVALDSSTLKLILDGFIRSGKYDSALQVLDYAERDLIDTSSLSPDIYSPVLVALVRKNQISIALSVFLKLLKPSPAGNNDNLVIPDSMACNELLVGLKKLGMKDEFKQVFRKLRDTNLYPLDRWGYNICIHTLGSWGDLSTSLSLFKEMKQKSGPLNPDLCTYNSLIHVLCLLGKVKDALIVWEELKVSSGHKPDQFTYRILIQGCSKSYRIKDAMDIFSEMQYNGVRSEAVVYNSLLDGLLKSRKLTEACNLFEKMTDDNVRASCCTYNILMDGLYKNGRPEAAYTLFNDLKRKGNNFVDGISYSIVILHLCREGQLEESLNLVEEMEARGFVIDLVTITSVLIGLYRRGQWDSTERLMKKHIRDGNLVLSILKWKSAMEGSLRVQQSKVRDFTPIFPAIKDISEILNLEKSDDMETENFKNFGNESDEWSSSPYMDMLANKFASNSQNFMESFTMLRGARVMAKDENSFDIDMMNTYLSIFLAKGKLSLACKLFEIFTSMGVDPVSYTYNSIMSSFVKKGYFREAWGVLNAMGETLNPSDIATYNIIIQGLGKMGRADLANSVLEKLMKEGGYLDIVMYNTLINVLGKGGRIEEANKLLEQMKASGINPDVVTYNTLIGVHSKAGRGKDAYKVLRMMLDDGCAPNHVTDTILDFLESESERLRLEKASIMRPSTDDHS